MTNINKTEKTFKLNSYTSGCGSRPERNTLVEGNLEYLTKYFSYTLKIGNSHKSSIKLQPTSIKQLISNVNKSYDIINACNYTSQSISLL